MTERGPRDLNSKRSVKDNLTSRKSFIKSPLSFGSSRAISFLKQTNNHDVKMSEKIIRSSSINSFFPLKSLIKLPSNIESRIQERNKKKKYLVPKKQVFLKQ